MQAYSMRQHSDPALAPLIPSPQQQGVLVS
jgi:hypothetical protein